MTTFQLNLLNYTLFVYFEKVNYAIIIGFIFLFYKITNQ